MSTVVTITNNAAPGSRAVVRVISQKIVDDGRELLPNGVDEVPAGASVDFIVNAGQSIRVVEEMLHEGAAAVPAAESAIAKVNA